MYTRLVVPVDGSELSELALPHAQELGRALRLPLHLVRVVDVVSGGFVMAEYPYSDNLIVDARQSETALADDYLARLKEYYTVRGLNVTTERRTGRVTQELLEAARDGDLFVMASHGRGGVSRWFLGSVVEEITRHSAVPVMVVRAETAEHRRMASILHIANHRR